MVNSNDIIAVEEINGSGEPIPRFIYTANIALSKIKEFIDSGTLFRYISRKEYEDDGFTFSECCPDLFSLYDKSVDRKSICRRAK